MGKHSCCYKQKLRKGLWSPEEDEKLVNHITKYGHGCWSSVPKQAGLQRCGKSCRLRWINYLRPDLKRGTFSEEEENLIIELHQLLGNRWSQIAARLPGRTDNEIKNLWNSCIKKKLRQKGIDPSTHKPLLERESSQDNAPTKDAVENITPKKSVGVPMSGLFLDQFIADQFMVDKYATECSDRPALWLNQDSRLFEVTQEVNCNAIPGAVISSSVCAGINGVQFSDAVYSSNSSQSSMNSGSGIELQHSSSYDSGIFPWSELTPEKDAQLQLDVGEPEELKWSEYLQGAFPIITADAAAAAAAAHTQTHHPLHCDVKAESQFTAAVTWHQIQHQHELLHSSSDLIN